MSNQPSEAALAFAGKLQEACLLDVNLYDLLQDDVARLLDAFAAQAVAAEREQIIKRLNRQIIGYIQNKHLDFETTITLKEATDIAIKIVKGE